jgi:hypothetical protein
MTDIFFSLCISVILCVTLCKFLIFCYTESHRGHTEFHRGKPNWFCTDTLLLLVPHLPG